MEMRADVLAEIKAQLATPGAWELISANAHVDTVPGVATVGNPFPAPVTIRTVTLTVEKVATGAMLIFMLEGGASPPATSGTLQWRGSALEFTDVDLIARLEAAIGPALSIAQDQLLAELTATPEAE